MSDSNWPYFNKLDSFLKMKYNLRRQTTNSENVGNSSTDFSVSNWKEQKEFVEILSKCRLCQKRKSEYSLTTDKELCQRIVECTSIMIMENSEDLPSGVCEFCKKVIDKFYEFLILWQEVNKELHTVVKRKEGKCFSLETQTDVDYLEKYDVLVNSGDILDDNLKNVQKDTDLTCEICSTSFSHKSQLYSHINQHFEIANDSTIDATKDEKKLLLDNNKSEEEYYSDVELLQGDNNDDDHDYDNGNNEVVAEDGADGIGKQEISEEIPRKIYPCQYCSKTFVQQNRLENHLEVHSRTVHACPRQDCNKTYTSINSLRNHERKHLGLNAFLCVSCGKGFVTNNALKSHEKIHQDVKEFVCDICCRGFSIMSNLRAHQKKHHEGYRFYCSQCPKEFLTKSSLQRHELVHTGVKEFVCDTCSSAFYTNKELIKHKRYHEGIRLHHCNQCFKTFYEKHHLTVHIRSHTGERPYPCKVTGCGKSFRESQKLSRHMKTYHKIVN